MKTLTELSGTLVRTAAAAVAEARRSLPREEERPVTPAVVVEPPAVEQAAPPEAAATPAAPAPAPDAESETVKAILDDAVAKATGCSGDRLAMLRDAVRTIGRRAGDVRLVRVFGVEEPLRGAQVVGERQYLVDYLPTSMKQVADASRGEKGHDPGLRQAALVGTFTMGPRPPRHLPWEPPGRPPGPPGRRGPPGRPPPPRSFLRSSFNESIENPPVVLPFAPRSPPPPPRPPPPPFPLPRPFSPRLASATCFMLVGR